MIIFRNNLITNKKYIFMFIFVTKKSAIRIIEIEQQLKSKGNVPKIVFPNLLS